MQTDPGEDSLLDLFRSRSWHSWNSPLMQNPSFKYKIHHLIQNSLAFLATTVSISFHLQAVAFGLSQSPS